MYTVQNAAGLEAARVGFHAAFLEQFGLPTAHPLEKLFTQVSSSGALEEWEWLGDLPDFEEWKGDRILSGLQAFKLQIRNKDWSNGIRIHQNDIADDKLGLIQPKIQGLAAKARSHRYRLGVKALLNGFAGTAYPDVGNGLAYDGAFFFSTAHATGANKMTSALSASALDAAQLLLESQTTYDGLDALSLSGTTLIVGPKLRATAEHLMKSEFLPSAAGTAAESNTQKGRYDIVVEPMLRGTFDDWWFLLDLSQPIKPMVFQLREDISVSAVVGGKGTTNDTVPRFQRGEIWFGAEARYNIGYFEHRAVVGSIVA